MKFFVALIVLVLVLFISVQLYRLNTQRDELSRRASQVADQIESLRQENEALSADMEYFSDAQNLIKELKTLFNYKKPGEKLFIIVPDNQEL